MFGLWLLQSHSADIGPVVSHVTQRVMYFTFQLSALQLIIPEVRLQFYQVNFFQNPRVLSILTLIAPLKELKDRDTKYGIFVEAFHALDRNDYCTVSYRFQALKDTAIFHLMFDSVTLLFLLAISFPSLSLSLYLSLILDLSHTTPLCLHP